jgi:hypothetical protein
MKYIMVRAYDDYISAHIAMGQLEAENVNGWLKDENTVTVDPAITYAVGGIKLMVPAVQAERADTLLRISENKLKRTGACPYCRTLNVEQVHKSPGALEKLITFFTGKEKITEPEYYCFDCKTVFKSPDKSRNTCAPV